MSEMMMAADEAYGINTGPVSGHHTLSQANLPSGAALVGKMPGPVEPVRCTDVLHSRVVRMTVENAPYDTVVAADDPDTGTISVRIACQTHPPQRWRRIGPRLIRQHLGFADAERWAEGLNEVLDRIEAAFSDLGA